MIHWPFRESLSSLVRDHLYEAERQLIAAKINKEHWDAEVRKLEARVRRLRSEVPAFEPTRPVAI